MEKKKSASRRVFRLSVQEARALQTIAENTGGSPDWSARGIVDKIGTRLERTFGRLAHYPVEDGSTLWFADGLD